MQINPTVYSLHLIMNEKGMECLTNMKKEINENKFTFQMKATDISILVK